MIDVSEWLIANTHELKIETAALSLPCVSGLQFGSRYIVDPQQEAVFDYLPEPMFKKVRNIGDFPRVLVLDKWTCNSDGRQVLFVKPSGKRLYEVTFIDQGYCFNAGEWNFIDAALRGVFVRNSVYEAVTGWESFEPALSRAEQIETDTLWRIAREIPREWYEGDTDGMSRLINSLSERRLRIRDLITSFRESSRNPFPNWIEG